MSLLLESFQQLMKKGHVVLVFALLCALGLHVTARVWVVTAVSMAVSVQVLYVIAGFLLQLKFGERRNGSFDDEVALEARIPGTLHVPVTDVRSHAFQQFVTENYSLSSRVMFGIGVSMILVSSVETSSCAILIVFSAKLCSGQEHRGHLSPD